MQVSNRHKNRNNQYFELGVRGRKTGLLQKQNVRRDSDGLANVDDFFDSEEEQEYHETRLGYSQEQHLQDVQQEEEEDEQEEYVTHNQPVSSRMQLAREQKRIARFRNHRNDYYPTQPNALEQGSPRTRGGPMYIQEEHEPLEQVYHQERQSTSRASSVRATPNPERIMHYPENASHHGSVSRHRNYVQHSARKLNLQEMESQEPVYYESHQVEPPVEYMQGYPVYSADKRRPFMRPAVPNVSYSRPVLHSRQSDYYPPPPGDDQVEYDDYPEYPEYSERPQVQGKRDSVILESPSNTRFISSFESQPSPPPQQQRKSHCKSSPQVIVEQGILRSGRKQPLLGEYEDYEDQENLLTPTRVYSARKSKLRNELTRTEEYEVPEEVQEQEYEVQDQVLDEYVGSSVEISPIPSTSKSTKPLKEKTGSKKIVKVSANDTTKVSVKDVKKKSSLHEKNVKGDSQSIPKQRKKAQKIPEFKLQEDEQEQGEDGARKSKRVKITPLAFWKNERIVYGRRDSGYCPVPVMKEIIRVESDPEDSKPNYKKKSEKVKPKKEEPVANMPILNYETHEEEQQQLVATPDMLDPRTVGAGNYRFQKVFSEKDFIASGVLYLPKGAHKPNKNSNSSAMIFIVMAGQVQVQIHKTLFTVGVGSQFFVPRGNQYKIQNIGNKEARLIFCHGKEISSDSSAAGA